MEKGLKTQYRRSLHFIPSAKILFILGEDDGSEIHGCPKDKRDAVKMTASKGDKIYAVDWTQKMTISFVSRVSRFGVATQTKPH